MLETQRLLGIPVKDAKNICERAGCKLRVTKEDKQPLLGTCEYDTSRVNVRVKNGKIAEIKGIG